MLKIIIEHKFYIRMRLLVIRVTKKGLYEMNTQHENGYKFFLWHFELLIQECPTLLI